MTVIDDRFASFGPTERELLEVIRGIVHEVVPDAEEVITYGMPGFKYKKKYLVAFNAFGDHLSLFPTSYPVEALQDKLGDYKLSKGTIQFTVDKPIPESLVREVITLQKSRIDGK